MKITTGRVNVQDFIFAKEVKLGTYSDNGMPPPGAVLSMQKMRLDPRAAPEYGERVPYLVAYEAGPKSRLVDNILAPEDFLSDRYIILIVGFILCRRSMQLHATYYITKQIIPSLARVFDLIGAGTAFNLRCLISDLNAWYRQMPKVVRAIQYGQQSTTNVTKSRNTIDKFYASQQCLVCNELTRNGKLIKNILICCRCLRWL
jgi:DNA polymerase zeta